MSALTAAQLCTESDGNSKFTLCIFYHNKKIHNNVKGRVFETASHDVLADHESNLVGPDQHLNKQQRIEQNEACGCIVHSKHCLNPCFMVI